MGSVLQVPGGQCDFGVALGKRSKILVAKYLPPCQFLVLCSFASIKGLLVCWFVGLVLFCFGSLFVCLVVCLCLLMVRSFWLCRCCWFVLLFMLLLLSYFLFATAAMLNRILACSVVVAGNLIKPQHRIIDTFLFLPSFGCV